MGELLQHPSQYSIVRRYDIVVFFMADLGALEGEVFGMVLGLGWRFVE